MQIKDSENNNGELILIDGGPASGKNTLGELLVAEFGKQGINAILLDLDSYVEEINPSWIWKDESVKKVDLKNARLNFVKDIDKHLQNNFIVIAIGERFLTKENIINITSKLSSYYPVYLYHLTVPFELRKQRLHQRGPHTLIDLDKDQNDRDINPKWYGYIYKNINSIETDVKNLFELIKNNKGLLDINNVIVKSSSIQGKGVYSLKNFRIDEVVLEIDDTHLVTDPKSLSDEEYESHCDYFDNKIFLMQSPEVYINHSCNPNTYVKTVGGIRKVLAMRDIKIGDEVTYDYSINGDNDGTFECHCGNKICRGVYQGNFFKLPMDTQKKYLPYLDDWFIKQYKDKIESIKTK